MSPFFAACLPVLMLACGFALEVGMMQLKNQQMQGAADAAVIAAELELERNNSSWATEGLQRAAYNGFTNGANNTTVSFSHLSGSNPRELWGLTRAATTWSKSKSPSWCPRFLWAR